MRKEVVPRPVRVAPHPLCGGTVSNWIRLVRRNPGVLTYDLIRVGMIMLGQSLSLPFRMGGECLAWGRRRSVEINHPPIFIVGHWRSGTTHLHNLMARDPQLGWLSLDHCTCPQSRFLRQRVIRFLLRWTLPLRRPGDEVAIGFDQPQEEEWLTALRHPSSAYHCFFLPLESGRILAKLLEPSRRDREAWCNLMIRHLRDLTVESDGRRLVLKNPANLMRIPQLLGLFPDARFIHIVRNPYEVYESTVRLWQKLLPWWSLQPYSEKDIPARALFFYKQLMTRYDRDVGLIPPGNRVDVRYEELRTKPLRLLEEVYQKLRLPNFDRARSPMKGYLDSVADYRSNVYEFRKETLELVYRHWQPWIDRWGYSTPVSTPWEAGDQEAGLRRRSGFPP